MSFEKYAVRWRVSRSYVRFRDVINFMEIFSGCSYGVQFLLSIRAVALIRGAKCDF